MRVRTSMKRAQEATPTARISHLPLLLCAVLTPLEILMLLVVSGLFWVMCLTPESIDGVNSVFVAVVIVVVVGVWGDSLEVASLGDEQLRPEINLVAVVGVSPAVVKIVQWNTPSHTKGLHEKKHCSWWGWTGTYACIACSYCACMYQFTHW